MNLDMKYIFKHSKIKMNLKIQQMIMLTSISFLVLSRQHRQVIHVKSTLLVVARVDIVDAKRRDGMDACWGSE